MDPKDLETIYALELDEVLLEGKEPTEEEAELLAMMGAGHSVNEDSLSGFTRFWSLIRSIFK